MQPGFIDLQVNGWMGTDFGAPGLTVDDVRRATRELVARGTAAFCPTVMTTRLEVYEQNLPVLAEAMRDPNLGGRILGVHLEGPFISPEPGAVGAHAADCVLDPDTAVLDRLLDWTQGRVSILTVAPERPGCEALIRHATSSGIVVSMGHHLASDEQLAQAVRAGATLCTHVGNGLPNHIHRHNNPLWWLLATDDVSGLFITDGHHLPADLIKVALRAKTVDRFIVTSDASPLGGLPPGRYRTSTGLPVIMTEDGTIYSEESRSLACSSATMSQCMEHLASLDLLTEEELCRVGFENPLRALGMKPEGFSGLDVPEVVP